MARLTLPEQTDLSPEQAEACAEAVSGIRGRVPAPMIAWIRNAELARRAQKLGELLRYQTTLEPKVSEMAILVTARHWTSHFEWTVHKREGLKAGMDPEVVAAIAERRDPGLTDVRERAVYDVAHTLISTARLPQALHDHGTAVLGERGMVELVALCGYYSMVAMTLNAFELGLPEAHAPELEG